MLPSGAWSPARRFGFRFVFALVVLAAPPLLNYAEFYLIVEPLKHPLAAILDGIFYAQLRVLSAIGELVTGWARATPSATGLLEFLAGLFLAALGSALLWTAIDRRRTQYVVLERWMSVYVRYQLAPAMFIYGLLKVWPAQFGWFRPSNLIRSFGDVPPQRRRCRRSP